LAVKPRPKKKLRDTILCRNSTVELNSTNDHFYHLWSTGEKTQKIKVTQEGTYWVKISNGICSLSDTIRVKSFGTGKALVPKEMSFCLNETNKTIVVKPTAGAKLKWNTGSIHSSIEVTYPGWYWVQSQVMPCKAQRDSVFVDLKGCECEMLIPNSFTPNEDNRNDYFFPVTECEYSYFIMTISDRWGNLIYTTNQSTGKWDGRFKGNLCPEEIYVYKIESTEKGGEKRQVRTGHVSLFR